MFVSVLGLLGVGLGACLLEATVRLFFPSSDFLWQQDPVIGMKLIPGRRGRSIKPDLFDVTIEINSAGFRDRERSVDKPNGARRVVLLGDSFVEAIQVPFEESITAVLEERLTTTVGPTEVINFGVSGAGTARQYLALREYGLKYKPDLVLVFFVGNDVGDNSRRLQGRSYLPYPQTIEGKIARDENGQPLFTAFNSDSPRVALIPDFIKDHWKSYRFLREAIDNSPAANRVLQALGLAPRPDSGVASSSDDFGFYEIYRVHSRPAWTEAWQLTEELLLHVRDLAVTNGAKFGVVLVPAAWEVYAEVWEAVLREVPAMRHTPLDVEQPANRLTTFLAAHDIPVMNLLPQFRTHASTSPVLYFRNDAHWTAEGHRLAAELLTETLTAMFRPKRTEMTNVQASGK